MTEKARPVSRIEFLQGTLDLVVLQTLRWGPNHGYGISQHIRTLSRGVLQVETGSLYPALHRLAKQGLISATWQISENKQRVRVYELTSEGRRHLSAERTRWGQFSEAVADLLNPPPMDEKA